MPGREYELNEKQTRAKYIQEFKQKAMRQVKAGRAASSVAPDLVQRRFTPATPNKVWSGDITYIATDEGWLYLAAVLAPHSRQVVGWSLQAHVQTSLVKDALLMACFRRRPAAGLIFHSDRGSQYCSQDFQGTLKAWAARSSMSRKGNC